MANMRLLVAILAIATTPAFAGWEVSTNRDRMTDRAVTSATVASGAAKLWVDCKNGSVFPEVTFSQRVGFGRIGVSYRFDQGSIVPQFVPLSQDGTELYVWLADPSSAFARLKRASRVRVQVGREVLDFDTTGAADALAKVKCG